MKKFFALALLVLSGCATPFAFSAEKPKYREIKAGVNTVRQGDYTENFYNKAMNSGLVDLHGFAGSSSVCFTFKFVPRNSEIPYVPSSLLVRLFDENGNYLTHFLTEKFSPSRRDIEIGAASAFLDSKNENQACYDISKMHADYTQMMEVGFRFK